LQSSAESSILNDSLLGKIGAIVYHLTWGITMKRGLFFVVAAVIAMVLVLRTQTSAQSDMPMAAVYIIGNPAGRDALRMAVNTFLIKSGKYQMVAVDAIDVIAKEHKRQMGGSVKDDQIAKWGYDVGAEYVCVVERTELDGVSYVATRMVSVESKVAEFADMVKLPKGGDIIEIVRRQIGAMLGMELGGHSSSQSIDDDIESLKKQLATTNPPHDTKRKHDVGMDLSLGYGFGGNFYFRSDMGKHHRIVIGIGGGVGGAGDVDYFYWLEPFSFYDWHFNLIDDGFLSWYIGLGGAIGYYYYNYGYQDFDESEGFGVGIGSQVGIDFHFDEDFFLGLSLRPMFYPPIVEHWPLFMLSFNIILRYWL